ncbi:MAG: hypothetical protein A2Z65_07730 [Gallionellales bacterium RIFCSPLOWO2_02_58_13]|nr:MAG: hypothetical protein A2Z65_07730 [Gallionellales bacterium RIFCSPLOWO2_02_58_13]
MGGAATHLTVPVESITISPEQDDSSGCPAHFTEPGASSVTPPAQSASVAAAAPPDSATMAASSIAAAPVFAAPYF